MSIKYYLILQNCIIYTFYFFFIFMCVCTVYCVWVNVSAVLCMLVIFDCDFRFPCSYIVILHVLERVGSIYCNFKVLCTYILCCFDWNFHFCCSYCYLLQICFDFFLKSENSEIFCLFFSLFARNRFEIPIQFYLFLCRPQMTSWCFCFCFFNCFHESRF